LSHDASAKPPSWAQSSIHVPRRDFFFFLYACESLPFSLFAFVCQVIYASGIMRFAWPSHFDGGAADLRADIERSLVVSFFCGVTTSQYKASVK